MSEQNDHRATALTFLHHGLLQLDSALHDRSRREARFVSLSTVSASEVIGGLARPDGRTVVVRGWSNVPPAWQFHTDRRAAKVSEYSLGHQVTAVFWEASRQLQIRLQGNASECLDAAVITKVWNDLGERGQQSFWRIEAPGAELEHPEALTFAEPDLVKASGAALPMSPNFMLVNVAVKAVDCLSLADDPHHRVQGVWTVDGWQARWVAP